MSVRIECSDCVEFVRSLEPGSVQLTVTSPPYDALRAYDGFGEIDYGELFVALYGATADGGVLVWVVDDAVVKGFETCTSHRQVLSAVDDAGWGLYQTLIWRKSQPSAFARRRYQFVHEPMYVFSKGRPRVANPIRDHRNKTAGMVNRDKHTTNPERRGTLRTYTTPEYSVRWDVWDVPRCPSKAGHPASFPERLARDHILTWSEPGDLVLDPFCGEGTTGVVAVSEGRSFVGCDISPRWAEVARERVTAAL